MVAELKIGPFIGQEWNETAVLLMGATQFLQPGPLVIDQLASLPLAVVQTEDDFIEGVIRQCPEVEMTPGRLEEILRCAIAVTPVTVAMDIAKE